MLLFAYMYLVMKRKKKTVNNHLQISHWKHQIHQLYVYINKPFLIHLINIELALKYEVNMPACVLCLYHKKSLKSVRKGPKSELYLYLKTFLVVNNLFRKNHWGSLFHDVSVLLLSQPPMLKPAMPPAAASSQEESGSRTLLFSMCTPKVPEMERSRFRSLDLVSQSTFSRGWYSWSTARSFTLSYFYANPN